PAQEQDPARAESSYKTVKDAILGCFSEVNDHVAAGDQIERAAWKSIAKQVVPGEADSAAGTRRHAESSIARRHEPAAGALDAHIADIARGVARARSSAIEDGLVNIGGQDGMALVRAELVQQHGQRVRLGPVRAACAPP